MESKLRNLLRFEAQEIKMSFEKASIEGQGTPQEIADRREAAFVSSFLKKYFPFPYRIEKGNIIDSYNNRSNSIDCIILNPSHPYTIDPKNERASIIFADGVDCAIEIKPDLANNHELIRSLDQIRSVKKLRRKRDGLLLKGKYNDHQLLTAKTIPSFIFADRTYVDLRLLISQIVEYFIKERVPYDEQFDYIVINNRGLIFNSRKDFYCDLKPTEGICFAETQEDTIATFLLLLNNLPKSEPAISESVLSFYLDNSLYSDKLKTFQDINEKMHAVLGKP
ncbi:MAG TPA: hypothetical protein PKG52_08795 [bacterium]|nr:hypothetical protein [bacterium]HPS29872.1 hypothetical protein [bacterium]